MAVNHHPSKPELTQADLDAWPNCAVADCENKVTWESDKCFPHTHGWEAVRANVRTRLAKAERLYKKAKTPANLEEIQWCQSELVRLKDKK